uniref:Translation initiation factor eIF2B subunit epsilon n=1 Tax=Cucumis melo subsp. melo TaxID=412675 RepID=E5GBQ7_CUCME|nr:eIF4-gamma/eIF5/eIF2-epsilon domain-containing protein [Cucumis melo subsp. melo]
MGAQRKGASRVSDDHEELARVSLQAVLLADSFTTKFRPITLERPKVLLPLVNVPMINYTLSWLESAGVEEVFVFCCANSKQVIDYLENSEWVSLPDFAVRTIESHNSISAGDALRLIYERNVIHGDFVLITGDTISNMSLTQALQEHKERKKKDSNAVMTMVVKRSKPSPITHQSRLGTDELFMAIDHNTKQLVYYEDKVDYAKGIIHLDKSLIMDNSSISLHNDMQDCYIDICSPEVLSLFTDNFDYQHLRRHFVKGLLLDDIVDVGSSSEILQARSAQVGPFTVIGDNSKIGDNTKITNSIIGHGCSIGSNVKIEGSYIWDNVTIEDGCKLSHAIVCDGVVIKSGAELEPGVILSFKVVVGDQFTVPSYSKVSLFEQPTNQDSDEELEYADNSSGIVEFADTTDKSNSALMSKSLEMQGWPASELGKGGLGYVWSICEGSVEEEWRHSVAPIPADKLEKVLHKAPDDEVELTQDANVLPPSGELKSDSYISDGDDNESSRDDSIHFEKEVEATFLRAVHENIEVANVILEVNSLRLSFNKVASDCAGAIFYSLMNFALDSSRGSSGKCYDLPFLSFMILWHLYDQEIIQEEAILKWDAEKKEADDSDKLFVKQAEKFIEWLKVASEEEEEEEEE